MPSMEPEQYKTESYPQELVEKVLARIKKLAGENGINPKDIKVNKTIAQTYVTEGLSIVSFKPSFSAHPKKIPKSEKFTALKSAKEAEAHAEALIRKSMTDSNVKDYIRGQFSSMPGKGFSADPENFAVSPLSTYYKIIQACGRCQGQAKERCGQCRGEKRIICPGCGGQQRSPCMDCRSTGSIRDPNGNQRTCPSCNGQRFKACSTCNAIGNIACPNCGAQGLIACPACKGRGETTEQYRLETQAKMASTINPKGIPDALKTLIDKIGLKRLIQNDHFSVNTANLPEEVSEDDPDIDKYSRFPPLRKEHDMHLFYALKIPFADLTIEINKTTSDLRILGKKGMIAECPTFLDDIVSRETVALEKRVTSEKLDKDKFPQSLKHKFLRDAWTLLQSNRPKKAMGLFQKKYGIAVERVTIQSLFHVLHQAKLKLTRTERYTVYAVIGILVLVGLGVAAYFLL